MQGLFLTLKINCCFVISTFYPISWEICLDLKWILQLNACIGMKWTKGIPHVYASFNFSRMVFGVLKIFIWNMKGCHSKKKLSSFVKKETLVAAKLTDKKVLEFNMVFWACIQTQEAVKGFTNTDLGCMVVKGTTYNCVCVSGVECLLRYSYHKNNQQQQELST